MVQNKQVTYILFTLVIILIGLITYLAIPYVINTMHGYRNTETTSSPTERNTLTDTLSLGDIELVNSTNHVEIISNSLWRVDLASNDSVSMTIKVVVNEQAVNSFGIYNYTLNCVIGRITINQSNRINDAYGLTNYSIKGVSISIRRNDAETYTITLNAENAIKGTYEFEILAKISELGSIGLVLSVKVQ